MTRARAIPDTITVHVPFRLVKHGGRKEMVLPAGSACHRPRIDNTIIKALARAFRWKRMMESGQFATTSELAEHEGIAVTYMTRVLRLTLLSPQTTEAIVNGRQPPDLKLADLLEPFPMEWVLQRWDEDSES